MPTVKTEVTFSDIVVARERIRDGLYLSPCPVSIPLSEICGFEAHCKLDYLQRTGSFKERGARNALMQLDSEQRRRGVIAASAGNHALGLAYHGKLLEIPVTVVMPRFAPLIKIRTCERLGARVVLHGDSFEDAQGQARELCESQGLTYIHAFDDPAVVAGQGTMGLEILEQAPETQAVVVPMGGGGLIAGLALAMKTQRPGIRVIGVEPDNAPNCTAALAAGAPVDVVCKPTLADGLAVRRMGNLTFGLVRKLVDRVVTVSEAEIALAILRLVELEKGVVEGAGATPLAAAMAGKLTDLGGQRVVLTLCGGNIDPTILSRVIEKGLVADGRLSRFTAVLRDRPGSLADFAALIGDAGASIKDVVHDRAFSGPDVSSVNVLCVVETHDREHVVELHRRLRAAGVEFVVHDRV